LDEVLKFGAEDLFKSDNNKEENEDLNNLYDYDIDEILSRSNIK
jgi:hypothetical protein